MHKSTFIRILGVSHVASIGYDKGGGGGGGRGDKVKVQYHKGNSFVY